MSRIYFHSLDGVAEVRGSERAHFGVFCSDLAWTFLKRYAREYRSESPSILRKLFAKDHYLHTMESEQFAAMTETALAVSFGDNFVLNGKSLDVWEMQLNTAFVLGNDAVKLGARLHGQCEIHTYVEGENRNWLADVVELGRRSGFYRADAGWEDVVKLLRQSTESPAVTSYSVTEQFPNGHIANFEYPEVGGEKDWDAWYALPFEKQWELGVTGLRAAKEGLELTPLNWNTFYFGEGHTVFTVVNELLKDNS